MATVSKKGVVKAKKEGKATITAKVDGKSLKCKITVKKQNVKPAVVILTNVGKLPYEKKLEASIKKLGEKGLEQLGYKDDEANNIFYSKDLYIEVPVSINSAKVICRTTDTKIGNYNGVYRYDMVYTGTITWPTKAYIERLVLKDDVADTDWEKIELDIPTDEATQKRLALLKDAIYKLTKLYVGAGNKSTEYKYPVWEKAQDGYLLRNLAYTDKEFKDYVSAFTYDASGNFTYTVYDLGFFEQFNYFRIEDITNEYYDLHKVKVVR